MTMESTCFLFIFTLPYLATFMYAWADKPTSQTRAKGATDKRLAVLGRSRQTEEIQRRVTSLREYIWRVICD